MFATYMITAMKLWVALVCIAPMLCFFILLKQKGQNRVPIRKEPSKVRPAGPLQPLADPAKFLTKENSSINSPNSLIYVLSPVMGVIVLSSFLMLCGPSNCTNPLSLGVFFLWGVPTMNMTCVLLSGLMFNSQRELLEATRNMVQTISHSVDKVLETIWLLFLLVVSHFKANWTFYVLLAILLYCCTPLDFAVHACEHGPQYTNMMCLLEDASGKWVKMLGTYPTEYMPGIEGAVMWEMFDTQTERGMVFMPVKVGFYDYGVSSWVFASLDDTDFSVLPK